MMRTVQGLVQGEFDLREIKHAWFLRGGKKYYFCNEAVTPTPEKLAEKGE